MIIDRHDSIMLQGYRKALLDISYYIDNHYHALSQERIMKVDVVMEG